MIVSLYHMRVFLDLVRGDGSRHLAPRLAGGCQGCAQGVQGAPRPELKIARRVGAAAAWHIAGRQVDSKFTV